MMEEKGMLRLLIADDHKWTREGLLKTIDWPSLGIEVSAVCENGAQAYVTLQQQPVDIVLTDIRMPGMDGIALAEIIHREHPGTALILMSAYQEFDYAYKAVNLGVCAYLLKPVHPEELQKTMAAVALRMGGAVSQPPAPAPVPDAAETPPMPPRTIVRKAKNYIAQNISLKSLNLKQTAEALHINYYYLSKCFKEDEKRTFTEYLGDTRLGIAQSLLRSTGLHVYEICDQIGMEPKNFHFLFHKEFGLSPKEYRDREAR